MRLPRDLVDDVRVLARVHDRSLSAELRTAVARYVSDEMAHKANVEWMRRFVHTHKDDPQQRDAVTQTERILEQEDRLNSLEARAWPGES